MNRFRFDSIDQIERISLRAAVPRTVVDEAQELVLRVILMMVVQPGHDLVLELVESLDVVVSEGDVRYLPGMY